MIDGYLKDWVGIFTAISTPCIALLAGYFTYSQAKTDELRRKQEIFEIRYAYYKKVRAIYIGLHEDLPWHCSEITDFFDLAEEASFLFGNDIAQHIIEMGNKHLANKIETQVRHGIIDDWFIKPFTKYLSLK